MGDESRRRGGGQDQSTGPLVKGHSSGQVPKTEAQNGPPSPKANAKGRGGTPRSAERSRTCHAPNPIASLLVPWGDSCAAAQWRCATVFRCASFYTRHKHKGRAKNRSPQGYISSSLPRPIHTDGIVYLGRNGCFRASMRRNPWDIFALSGRSAQGKEKGRHGLAEPP
jgi:hypothetical protein